MGNTIKPCFSGGHHHVSPATVSFEPHPDDSIGHSFSYLPPTPHLIPSSNHPPAAATAGAGLYAISGAAISANQTTPLSTSNLFSNSSLLTASTSFESSRSFTSNVLQSGHLSGPLSGPLSDTGSVYSDRSGFYSGHLSGPLSCSSSLNSTAGARLHRSISQIVADHRARRCRRNSRSLARLFSKLCRIKKATTPPAANGVASCKEESERGRKEDNRSSVQWAQGKAGEDRVHVVVSEEHGWVFVGIYDGFNGPDATDFLQTHLYPSVHLELKTLFVNDGGDEPEPEHIITSEQNPNNDIINNVNRVLKSQRMGTHQPVGDSSKVNNKKILNALSEALKRTEKTYFEMADRMAAQNPELAMMGSCVLVALMKGEHVYLMNVGDSRAVLAQRIEPDLCDLVSRSPHDTVVCGDEIRRAFDVTELSGLAAKQLSYDHSTSNDEEVRRIEIAHPDDPRVVENDKVKGKLQVTRAFGAGFLKSPKWNDQVLEAFKIKNYIGTLPYITCIPSLYHHKIRPEDKFLVLSSDGLYQYFTNEELVNEINLYVSNNPDGDPAQYLVEEVLHRAANKYDMDFHELINIPNGDRRKYHDDVSIIIISLEGRMWRSSM